MRHDELISVIMEGKVERTKARGRQRKMYLDDNCTWTNQEKKNVTIRKYKDGESITLPPTSPGDGTLHDTS